MIQIVLVEPKIPQNTGSTARLTAATNCMLHLVEPLGFELSDRYLKRAGLDYWQWVSMKVHSDWNAFLETEKCAPEQLWFFSTKAQTSYFDVEFKDNDYLVFGSETEGLSKEFHDNYRERFLNLPMDNPNIRSINLSNAVTAAYYEARRQLQGKKE